MDFSGRCIACCILQLRPSRHASSGKSFRSASFSQPTVASPPVPTSSSLSLTPAHHGHEPATPSHSSSRPALARRRAARGPPSDRHEAASGPFPGERRSKSGAVWGPEARMHAVAPLPTVVAASGGGGGSRRREAVAGSGSGRELELILLRLRGRPVRLRLGGRAPRRRGQEWCPPSALRPAGEALPGRPSSAPAGARMASRDGTSSAAEAPTSRDGGNPVAASGSSSTSSSL
jgi:hypothetical protein